MNVVKRNGVVEEMKFDKLTTRIKAMCKGLDSSIDPQHVAMRTIESLFDGVTTSEIDTLISEIAASMVTKHPQYAKLSSNIAVSNLQKNTKNKFSAVMKDLYEFVNPRNNQPFPLISKDLYETVIKPHAKQIDEYIDCERDFNYDIFGFKTLERSYLLKIDGKIVERPQYMLMRVCLGIHWDDLDNAFKTYDLMSKKVFTHATPTLFNSGTMKPQMSSCFLLDVEDDSIDGIYDTLKSTARISKSAGGVGMSIHNVRAAGSFIAGTNGTSNGIVPMLRVFNETAKYVDQGGGKRKGSFAIYLEPWHADFVEFLDLRKNHGKEEMRARDLFLAMWTPDLFMKRVKEDGVWSLMCPNEAKGLAEVYDEEGNDQFTKLYERYEAEGNFKKQMPARELWKRILDSQIETGTPYMLYKDAVNRKSNQKNLGTIKLSNLCTEIVEYTSKDEIAVCNLASISLPAFVKYNDDGTPYFDYRALEPVVHQITFNLNRVIDRNWYPAPQAEYSNMKHRPIGIGVQGLADVYQMLGLDFESEDARYVNKTIHEVIQYSALWQSMEIAKEQGHSYESFEDSPISKGIFQWQLWGLDESELSGICDWNLLREYILEFGLANSLVTASMPTASTSQILGNNEAFEPYTSNLYTRRTLSGEHIVVNNHLINELTELGLWTESMRMTLMAGKGSIQNTNLPQYIKNKYKTAYEMSMKSIIQQSADRGPFICQSQSLNLFVEDANHSKLTSMHFFAWSLGLKTGMYYLRTKAAVDAIQFTVDKQAIEKETIQNVEAPIVIEEEMSVEDYKAMLAKAKEAQPEDCEMCGS